MSEKLSELVRQAVVTPVDGPPVERIVRRARSRRRRRHTMVGMSSLVIVLVGALTVSALSGQRVDLVPAAPATEPAPPNDPEVLRRRTFVSVSVLRNGQPWELVDGTPITITFDRLGLWSTFRAGCNDMGVLVVTEDRIGTRSGYGVTEYKTLMGCSEAHHAQDRWLQQVFRAGMAWRLEDDHRLHLEAGGTVIVLEEAPFAGIADEGGGPDGSFPDEEPMSEDASQSTHPPADSAPDPAPTPSSAPPSATLQPSADPSPAPSSGPGEVRALPYLQVSGSPVRSPVRANEQLVIRYTNTGAVPVLYGAEYRYERQEAGQWVAAQGPCPGACTWPSIGYRLDPGDTTDFEASTTGLLPGRYRILKDFFDDSEEGARDGGQRQSVRVAVEFEIDV